MSLSTIVEFHILVVLAESWIIVLHINTAAWNVAINQQNCCVDNKFHDHVGINRGLQVSIIVPFLSFLAL
jgi:hypothetical protein